MLTRVAASHIRVGTFEWAAAHRDPEALRALADYTIRRHYPEVADAAAPYLALFDAVVERQAALIAQWQLVGFIHGVMNTDNMALSGETIDYGPCAFMDRYDPATVFSSIDEQRALRLRQPAADRAVEPGPAGRGDADALRRRSGPRDRTGQRVDPALRDALQAPLAGRHARQAGLVTEESDDAALADALLTWMHDSGADFTNTFRTLSTPGAAEALAHADPAYAQWHRQWQARLARQTQTADEVTALMQRSNPAVIPRNHKVEEALTAASEQGDLRVLDRLMAELAAPFDYTLDRPEFTSPPAADARPYRTFCGT